MNTMTVKEFHAACKAQASCAERIVFKCPMCGTLQCAQDLINAGAGADLAEVERYLGFSCVGRFTGAGSPRSKPDGKPCNWTLGGFFKMHKLEVITPDGKHHPSFELASHDEAAAHNAAASECQESA